MPIGKTSRNAHEVARNRVLRFREKSAQDNTDLEDENNRADAAMDVNSKAWENMQDG